MGRGRVLAPGKPFPTFRLTAIGGGAADFTNEIFSDKLTLIDFGGAWRGPCVDEMPFLHRAYDHFKDRGFT